MVKQIINVGTIANDGSGSPIRTGGQFINSNFTEIYNALGDGSTITFDSSTAVTLTGTQTLENKTIDLSVNTITGTIAEFNTALSDGSFVTLAGSEALTNKDLTGSGNTFPSISFIDETSTSSSIQLGGELSILGTGGVNTAISGSQLTISISSLDATSIADGSVSNTEFQHLNGVTSNIQTQITAISGGISNLVAAIALG